MRREDILDYEIFLTNEDDTDIALLVVEVIDHQGKQYAILMVDEGQAKADSFDVTILEVSPGAEKGEVEFAWVEEPEIERAVFRKYGEKVKKLHKKQMEQARDWFFKKYGDGTEKA